MQPEILPNERRQQERGGGGAVPGQRERVRERDTLSLNCQRSLEWIGTVDQFVNLLVTFEEGAGSLDRSPGLRTRRGGAP